MLGRLHPEIRVLAQKPGASEADTRALAKLFPGLPVGFLDLMREATELELSYRGVYLRLCGPKGCIEMDEAYQISRQVPGAITVGDNGGSEAIVFMSLPPGPGLFRLGYGALAIDELSCVAESLEAALVHAEPEPSIVGTCIA